MASYTDRFGQGMMPLFNIAPGATTPLDVGADAAATEAAYFDMMDQRAASNASNISAFTEGIESLKGLMSDEDQEEEILQNMLMNEAVAPIMGPSGDDAATGKFTPSYDVEPTIMQRAIEGGKGLFGKAVDYVKENPIESALTAGSFFNLPLAAIMGGYHYGKENPIPTPEDAVKYGHYEDGNLGVAMDKSGFFDEGSIQRQRELNEALANPDADLPSWYDEMDHEGSMAGAYDSREFANGGRVNYNTGGLTYAYSPFMNMQQGIDYYGQFADAVPRYGQFSPITSPGELVDDGVKSDPTNPIFTDLGTLEGPRGGPEDRGSYADRFGTAEDQGYGYSGTPGEGGSGTFNNPAFGEYGDTFTPGPGIGQAYDEYGRLRDIGVLNDIGLNAYDGMYGASQQIPGFLGAAAALVGSFFDRTEEKKQKEIDEFNKITANQVLERQKKEQEEREAAAAQAAAEQAAADEAAQTLKETYAANQYSGGTGSGDNKPSPGTGTFSGGVMSGFTGGGQSPHSSMSSSNSPTGVGGQTPGPRGERGGAGGKGPQGRSRCFVKGTMVEMADGTTKEITTITPGMETRGGTVEFVLQGLPVDIWDYKGVKVSGTHWVVEDNQLIAVEDSKHGIKTDMFEPVYSMKTSKQRMWVKGIEFGDFESGTDEDWEPYFEKVRQDLNKKLHEKRKENQQSDERV